MLTLGVGNGEGHNRGFKDMDSIVFIKLEKRFIGIYIIFTL